jgi:hypothetical protein
VKLGLNDVGPPRSNDLLDAHGKGRNPAIGHPHRAAADKAAEKSRASPPTRGHCHAGARQGDLLYELTALADEFVRRRISFRSQGEQRNAVPEPELGDELGD